MNENEENPLDDLTLEQLDEVLEQAEDMAAPAAVPSQPVQVRDKGLLEQDRQSPANAQEYADEQAAAEEAARQPAEVEEPYE